MNKLLMLCTFILCLINTPVYADSAPSIMLLPNILPKPIDYPPDRTVTIFGEIGMDTAEATAAELRALDKEAPGVPILLRIDSPGGVVYAGLMIIDVMKSLKSPVATRCEGVCMSMAAVILSAGSEGSRSALPSATILVHEAGAGQIGGKLSELLNEVRETERLNNIMISILSENLRLSPDEVKILINHDNFMDATSAKAYGIIDTVGY